MKQEILHTHLVSSASSMARYPNELVDGQVHGILSQNELKFGRNVCLGIAHISYVVGFGQLWIKNVFFIYWYQIQQDFVKEPQNMH
jgi:hypothetical protein